ncbi:hypothetical protein BHECKSOX2_1510 [Bathymodiolus heckerae thiotrophic gill symbiont]|nr:hypothetical protein BHECKSOX2_1510 [Bathymodiolus heckerae thiotrophic gill symbiont]
MPLTKPLTLKPLCLFFLWRRKESLLITTLLALLSNTLLAALLSLRTAKATTLALLTLTVMLSLALLRPSLSETLTLKVRSVSFIAAVVVKLALAVSAPVNATLIPVVCVHVYLRSLLLPSGSFPVAVRVTLLLMLVIISAPAFTVGVFSSAVSGVLVMLMVILAVLSVASVPVILTLSVWLAVVS